MMIKRDVKAQFSSPRWGKFIEESYGLKEELKQKRARLVSIMVLTVFFELSPCDILFPNLKMNKFSSNQDIITTVDAYLIDFKKLLFW